MISGLEVSQLQGKFGSSQQLHPGTIDTADIDSVMIAQTESSQLLPVQFGTGDDDALRNQLAVDSIPIDIFLVPIRILLFTEQYGKGQCVSIIIWLTTPTAATLLSE
jgi:hypothetical protein